MKTIFSHKYLCVVLSSMIFYTSTNALATMRYMEYIKNPLNVENNTLTYENSNYQVDKNTAPAKRKYIHGILPKLLEDRKKELSNISINTSNFDSRRIDILLYKFNLPRKFEPTSKKTDKIKFLRYKASLALMNSRQDSLSEVFFDTISFFEIYRNKLSDIQKGCIADNKEVCYSISAGLNADQASKNIATIINFGYGISDNISIGTTSAKYFNEDFSRTHVLVDNSNTYTVNNSAYASIHTSLNDSNIYWYLNPSIAVGGGYELNVNRYSNKIIHPKLESVISTGKSQVNGFSAMLKGGQNITLDSNVNIDWNIGITKLNIYRDKYSESMKSIYPVQYNKLVNDNKLITLSAKINLPVINRLRLISGFDLEHEFNNIINQTFYFYHKEKNIKDDTFKNGISKDISSIGGSVYSGLIYHFNKYVNLSLTASINKSHNKSVFCNGIINVNGNF